MTTLVSPSPAGPRVRFDDTYARELEGLCVRWRAEAAPAPRLAYLNRGLAVELGFDVEALAADAGAAWLAGNAVPEGANPIAQAYAGHQFGGFVPLLGDGRALLVGELIDRTGRRRDVALKGSGRTPFSRGGDGRAALGPMLREALMGEAMHALGIPTTRALAVVATGASVQRETRLPGAVLARVAASHLRVGTFQLVASRGDGDSLRRLADYAIHRHDASLASSPDRHAQWFAAVVRRQATLIADWLDVGFVHGVMNTDNMTLSGETIDYGPCAFLESYEPGAVFSSIDHLGRYAYANQPAIALWNLERFAESVLPLLADTETAALARAVEILDGFLRTMNERLLQRRRARLGLVDEEALDEALIDDWLALLEAARADHTLAWRSLAAAAAADEGPLRRVIPSAAPLDAWLARWRERAGREARDVAQRVVMMRRASPLVVPRNHRVEEALAAATMHGELGPFEQLLAAVQRPFDDVPEHARFGEPAPAEFTARYQTFCGT